MTEKRVLLADPDPEARTRWREVFHRAGADVLEAADGREALVAALVRPPSLIVMETRLPLVNGAALCEILRRDSMTRGVRIVALVDGGSSAEADRLRRAGADLVVAKPVDPDELLMESHRLTAGGAATVRNTIPDYAPVQASTSSEPATGRRRVAISKIHPRFTTTNPPSPPPLLRCPNCDGALTYECSHVGGVSTRYAEQWDDYICAACGAFEYRHRTRKLRQRQVPA